MNSLPDSAVSDDLQKIAAEAALLEAETAPAAADPAAPAGSENVPQIDFQAEAKDLMDFSLAMLFPFYPCLETIYNPETVAKLAAASGRLMEKYGFTFGEFMTKWGPEIGFVIVAGPLIPKTYKAIKAETKQLEAAQPPATPMQPIIDKPEPGALHSKV